MTKPAPRIPPVPKPARKPLTKMETVYIGVLRHWYKHAKRAPTIFELAALCRPRRSHTAVRNALLSAEDKGYVRRNDYGRFEVIE